jgi:hypothetical protein
MSTNTTGATTLDTNYISNKIVEIGENGGLMPPARFLNLDIMRNELQQILIEGINENLDKTEMADKIMFVFYTGYMQAVVDFSIKGPFDVEYVLHEVLVKGGYPDWE